ncbi:MAG: putative metal-binding motif-containing protein [Myxococcota bacterium]
MTPRFPFRLLGRSLLLVLLAACGDGPTVLTRPDIGVMIRPDIGMDDLGMPDLPDMPDLGPECVEDTDCDDRVDCTRDFCEDGICRNQTDPAFCNDDVFCNGVEICDPSRGGCVAGDPETCNDDDVCTIDRCDEEERLCRFLPRDFDEDGEADFNCEGGTDCNDFDPRRGSLIPEICEDRLDNDCDGVVDEPDCGRPDGDDCDIALTVDPAGEFFEIDASGAVADFELTCTGAMRKDIVFELTVTEPRSLNVRAEARGTTFVELRTTCEDRTTALECRAGFPGALRRRRLEPGTYYVVVAAPTVFGTEPNIVAVEFDLDDPLPDPVNETCDGAIDVSAGGIFTGNFVDAVNDGETDCSFGSSELYYTFTTTETQDVVLSAAPSTGGTLGIAVTTTCGDVSTEIACTRTAPATRRLYSLPAGTYFFSVESVSSREVDLTLDVRFLPPSDPPPGDDCRSALEIPIVPGGTSTVSGTLEGKQDEIDVSCGFNYRDSVHFFTLTERSDVVVEVDGGGTFMFASVRETCDDGDSQLRCTSGNPSRSRLRNLTPGTYFVIVETFTTTDFDISVTVDEPTVPVPVVGNDDCVRATTVPETGGVFTGNTSTLLDDYETRFCGASAGSPDAAFELTLTSRRRVVVNTEGSAFNTVLHRHDRSCTTAMEAVCDDNGGEGLTSFLDQTLSAGTYFFIVDGFGSFSSGDYVLEVDVLDP